MLCRIYLRASDAAQDATRARIEVEQFARDHGLTVVNQPYIENESGTRLDRPELWRLIRDSQPNDVILLEAIDRLSRLSEPDWQRLRNEIEARQLRVIAKDLPTSWMLAKPGEDEFTTRMMRAVNGMLMDMLAAVARKDWSDRRRRQQQGIEKARREHPQKYRGRPENVAQNGRIATLLEKKVSWSDIQEMTGCSRATVAKIAARRRAVAAGEAS